MWLLILACLVDVDYKESPTSVTIRRNTQGSCFTPTILDDDKYELRDEFFINLTSTDSTLIIDPHFRVVSILDDDGKFYCCWLLCPWMLQGSQQTSCWLEDLKIEPMDILATYVSMLMWLHTRMPTFVRHTHFYWYASRMVTLHMASSALTLLWTL